MSPDSGKWSGFAALSVSWSGFANIAMKIVRKMLGDTRDNPGDVTREVKLATLALHRC